MTTFVKNTFGKLWWRIHFFLVEMWGKNWRIICYTLLPFVRRQKHFREHFLKKRGLITWDDKKESVTCRGLTFFYKHKLPTADLISILLAGDPYIKRNFIDNSAFRLEGPYESGAVLLQKGDVVLDVGANIGIFSLLAADKIGIKGKVFAFEPIAQSRALLKKNIVANNVENIEIVSKALGEKVGSLMLSINEKELGGSSAVLNQEVSSRERVEQVKLDDFVQECQLKKVNFIKTDIEGMERNFLKGAEETIKKFKPKLTICIYHLPDDPEVISGMVRRFVPEYTTHMSPTKLYAWI